MRLKGGIRPDPLLSASTTPSFAPEQDDSVHAASKQSNDRAESIRMAWSQYLVAGKRTIRATPLKTRGRERHHAGAIRCHATGCAWSDSSNGKAAKPAVGSRAAICVNRAADSNAHQEGQSQMRIS